jgi:hypothetical protein
MVQLILFLTSGAMQTCETGITLYQKKNVHIFRVEIIVVGIQSRYLAKREDIIHSEPKER